MGGYTQIIQAITSRAAGIESQRASKREARAIKKQGAKTAEEARVASERELQEGERFQARQKLSFLKSGVSLEGSPLLALAETEEEFKTRAAATKAAGEARFQLARDRAKNLRIRGRAAILGSTAQSAEAAGQATTAFQQQSRLEQGTNNGG